MCGRYWIGDEDREELREQMARLNRSVPPEAKAQGDIFPGDRPPVLARARSGGMGCFAMKWGFALPGRRDVINARSETAGSTALFRDSFRERRCVLPGGYYFEWERRGKEKVRHAIWPAGANGILLAGLYRLSPDGAQCVVLTRASADGIAFIHDRMPVLLPKEAVRDWLDPGLDAAGILKEALQEMRHEERAGT